jgi:carbamoyl-phosphate synthase large subunit
LSNNILITSAGRRVGLVKAFQFDLKKFFPNSKVYTAESNPLWSSACRISDGFFTIPRIESKDYVNAILDICLENNIKIIIPTLDTELLIFSLAKEIFKFNCIEIIVSDYKLISFCRDKRKTADLFNEIGIRVPSLIDKYNPTFPLFIKPYDGSLSKDIYYIENKEELNSKLLNDSKLMFMEYISSDIFQEYTIDAYYDKNNYLKCLVPRYRVEVRGGEISKGRTERKWFYEILKKKLNHLSGAIGCLTFQFFIGKYNNEIVGIEINPRFGGGFPLSYSAGANYPKYIIQEYLLNDTIPFFENWIENRVMLRYDSEIILDEHDFNEK